MQQSANLLLNYAETLAWPIAFTVTVIALGIILRRRLPSDHLNQPFIEPKLESYKIGKAEGIRTALQNAEAMNSTDIAGRVADPLVRLQNAARFTPSDYLTAGRQIGDHLRAGRVVIVDLNESSDELSVRLIDFCSGLIYMSQGWIYRATNKVLVLTPQQQRR